MSEDYKSQKDRSEGGSAPGDHSTEKDRKTGTEVVKSPEIEKRLGRGGGNRAPFGRRVKR